MNFPASPGDVFGGTTGGGGPDGAAPWEFASVTESSATLAEDLFRECRESLTGYFLHRHHSRALVEDLVQETFLRLLRGFDRLRTAASPRAYLFGIARHVSSDAWRRLPPPAPEDTAAQPVAELVAPMPDPRVACAREAIAALPPMQREILDLRFQHDLAYAEIASVLGIPIGTVRSRLHNALRRVRDELEKES